VDGNLFFIITILGLAVLILVLCVVFGLRFSAKFKTVTIGMTYEKVITILGEPRSLTTSQEIMTCIWKRAIIRDWTMFFTITFIDGKVVSAVKG